MLSAMHRITFSLSLLGITLFEQSQFHFTGHAVQGSGSHLFVAMSNASYVLLCVGHPPPGFVLVRKSTV